MIHEPEGLHPGNQEREPKVRSEETKDDLLEQSHPTHSIRLGPPWQMTTTAENTQHTRKFGRPRTLDTNERLWLVCEFVPGQAEVRLNGTVVGNVEAAGPSAMDITALLQPRNEVTFAVNSGDALGLVVLEVRSA